MVQKADVIGAGIAGLSVAYELREYGSVNVLASEERQDIIRLAGPLR